MKKQWEQLRNVMPRPQHNEMQADATKHALKNFVVIDEAGPGLEALALLPKVEMAEFGPHVVSTAAEVQHISKQLRHIHGPHEIEAMEARSTHHKPRQTITIDQ